MNRILIMCEGPNEKAIIDILLANDCLVFSQDDLLGLTPFHARQIATSTQVRAELNMYPGKVDYEKVKSDISPKEFAKMHIRIGKRRYDNSSKFYQDYFGNNVASLVSAIKKYQRIKGKGHQNDELCLGELLK